MRHTTAFLGVFVLLAANWATASEPASPVSFPMTAPGYAVPSQPVAGYAPPSGYAAPAIAYPQPLAANPTPTTAYPTAPAPYVQASPTYAAPLNPYRPQVGPFSPGVQPYPAPIAAGTQNKRNWGPEQATGAPDTPNAGDIVTAWAPRTPQGTGVEWLRLQYARPVEIKEVHVRETFNPGAISKVVALAVRGREDVLWEGREPRAAAPTDFVVTPNHPVVSDVIIVYLDRTRVPGWNEIDAVELVGTDGSRQWAMQATASSTYAEPEQMPAPAAHAGPTTTDEFSQFLQRPIKIHLEGGEALQGVLMRVGPRFLVVQQAGGHATLLINKERVVYAETKDGIRGTAAKPPHAERPGNDERRSGDAMDRQSADDHRLAAQVSQAKVGDFWAKYKLWEGYHKGNRGMKKNAEEAQKWLLELVKGAYVATFRPTAGFAPKTPAEFLDKFANSPVLKSDAAGLGGGSFFRTRAQDGTLIGSFLTARPLETRKALEATGSVEVMSVEVLTPDEFIRYEASPQESLK